MSARTMRAPTALRAPTSASFEAIGTTCQVLVTEPDSLPEAVRIVRGHLDVLDRAVSRFRSDSELSRLSAAASDGPAEAQVSSVTLEYVDRALRVAERTGGLVDPTVGAALAATGYDADLDVVRARTLPRARNGGSSSTARVPGWRSVRVDHVRRTVAVPQATVLDLGSTAKAHAADVTARLLLDRLRGGFLVNLGGDLAVSGAAPAGGWRVGIETIDGTDPEVVTTQTLGLATSSTLRRVWRVRPGPDGIRHHIVDPRTADTADTRWALVTCAAATALEANADATAAVVLGDDAPAWLEACGVAARLTDRAGRVTTTRGWPARREAVPA